MPIFMKPISTNPTDPGARAAFTVLYTNRAGLAGREGGHREDREAHHQGAPPAERIRKAERRNDLETAGDRAAVAVPDTSCVEAFGESSGGVHRCIVADLAKPKPGAEESLNATVYDFETEAQNADYKHNRREDDDG